MPIGLGIDFGTSGARAIALNTNSDVVFEHHLGFTQQSPLTQLWQSALFELLEHLPYDIASQLEAIAINGTSATVLLCDAQGNPQTEPLLYNDDRGRSVLEQLKAIAPPNHTVLSATSSLSKLLWWQQEFQWNPSELPRGWKLLHQADWLAFLLHGKLGLSDYHNALKLGYDPGILAYPNWLEQHDLRSLLPEVLTPGQAIGPLKTALAQRFGINYDCQICAGTTDSIAAFLASGVSHPGDAVTSLGSTLVLKLLSKGRVDNATYGIYSHRLGEHWLVGGASNTGGAVLQQFFDNEQLRQRSAAIDPAQASPLDYYPLLRPGERFPTNDPNLQPRLTPRPDSDTRFLHGLLESMARIEAEGYGRLQALGSTPLTRVVTAGGGAQNQTWSQIRQRCLQVPVSAAAQTQAAYGTARLAGRSMERARTTEP